VIDPSSSSPLSSINALAIAASITSSLVISFLRIGPRCFIRPTERKTAVLPYPYYARRITFYLSNNLAMAYNYIGFRLKFGLLPTNRAYTYGLIDSVSVSILY